MSFGGGSPGMSILIGVAKGVAEDDKRRREMEQEAINKRLKEQQIQQMQENTEFNKQREQRYRDTEVARQEEVATARATAEANRAQEEERRQMLTGLAAQQTMKEFAAAGEPITEEEAYNMSVLQMEGIDYATPDPEEEVSWAEKEFMLERSDGNELAMEMDAIIRVPELSTAVQAAKNPVEAQMLVDDYNAKNNASLDSAAGRAVWTEAHQGDLDPGLDYGDYGNLPSYAQRDVSREAAILVGHSLVEAEKTIGTWQAADADDSMQNRDPYDLAEDIIIQKIKKYQGGDSRDQAVMDRLLIELARMQQEHREDDSGDDPYRNRYNPSNVPIG